MPLPTLSRMTPDDLDEIMVLERQCFADAWTRRMYYSDLMQNEMATYLVLRWTTDDRAQTMDDRQQAVVGASRSEAAAIGTPRPPMVHRPSAIVAYGGFWLLVDEAHVATLASHPEHRGCGLGQWLMLALLDTAVARGAVWSTLEVRAGNLPARALYLKLGYAVAGVRKHYYRDGEDGVIMTTPPLADPAVQARLAAARADALTRLERCFGGRSDGR